MARNVEIKARLADRAALVARLRTLAGSGPTPITQDDTFFVCANGRMKLRVFADGLGELIFYRRADAAGPKASFYVRTPTADPASLRQALSLAYGEMGRVRKQRELYMIGRTRVHVDLVEGLGDFIELEVVLADDEPAEAGVDEAQRLMAALGIDPDALIEGAYLDLIRSRKTMSIAAVAEPAEHLPRAEDFLLWPPALQPYGYRIVDRLFASRPIRRGSSVRPLPRGPALDVEYEAEGVRRDVDAFMDRNRVAGLLVIHDGAVRLERYGLGLRPDDRWSTMSTVKSMTAVLVGAAVRDGAMSLDEPVTRHLPALAGSAYEHVRLRDLITMSSGVAWSEAYDDRHSDVNRYSKSLADKVPGGVLAMMRELPAAHSPGTFWHYNSGDTYLLGAALSNAVGMPLADYMASRIWQPCGMEFDAFYTLESEGGQEIGGSRAGVALRDFGRFASLVIDDGVVDGRRLLPERWIDDCGRMAFRFDDAIKAAYPRIVSGGLEGYGYSWWIDGDGAMIANGFAGQRIYVDRHVRLAIVTLAAFPQPPYVGPGEHDHVAEVVTFTRAVRAALAH